VSGGPEHLVMQMVSHRYGRGDDDSARTGPFGMAGPLKAHDVIVFSRCVVLGVQRPPTGRPRWREQSLTSGLAPI
jgi:hypothetical protein